MRYEFPLLFCFFFLLFSTSSFAETRTPVLIDGSIAVHSGDLLQKETDLKIPGRGFDYEFTRVYRSRITYEGPLGANWDHNYNKRLIEREDGTVARFDGQARFDIYEKQADGSYKSPSGYFDRLAKNADGTFTIRDKHGTLHHYGADGYVSSIVDRNGNVMRFEYEDVLRATYYVLRSGEEEQRLVRVVDTVGRAISYFYNAQGRLQTITDFSGRTIQFSYDAVGNITSFIDGRGNAFQFEVNNLNQVTREVAPASFNPSTSLGAGYERRIEYRGQTLC